MLSQPGQKSAAVLDRVLALEAIVQVHEALAVTRRTTHIGQQDGKAHFVEVIVPAPHEMHGGLPFRAAVEIDHHWPLARKLGSVGQVEPAADGQAIKALDAHQLGADELIRIHTGRGKGGGPALGLAVGDVVAVNIARALRRIERESKLPGFAFVPAAAADGSSRDVRARQFLATGSIEQSHFIAAIVVDNRQQTLAVFG